MHCPDSLDGNEYIALVTATSALLAGPLSDAETYILAEFMQAVSNQLFTLAAFKTIEGKNPPHK